MHYMNTISLAIDSDLEVSRVFYGDTNESEVFLHARGMIPSEFVVDHLRELAELRGRIFSLGFAAEHGETVWHYGDLFAIQNVLRTAGVLNNLELAIPLIKLLAR